MLSRSCRVVSLVCSAVLLFVSASIAVNVDIAGEKIDIPAPAGFTEVRYVSQDTFSMLEDTYSAGNHLLAVFVSQSDAGKLLQGDSAVLREYMTVTSVKQLEDITLAKHQFSELRTMLKKKHESIFHEQGDAIHEAVETTGEVLSRRLNSNVKFDINSVAPLGVVGETASSISTSQLTQYDVSVSGQKEQVTVAGAVSAVLVKGKVLYLNVFKTYTGQEDVNWTTDMLNKWLPEVFLSNDAGVSIPSGRIVPNGTPMTEVTKQLLSEEQRAFKSSKHPKAHGLNVSIRYPKSWKAEEGTRPHIVQKFTGLPFGGITPSCMLLVQKLPSSWARLLLDGDTNRDVLTESLRDMVPPGAKYIDGATTKIDGEPAAWLKYSYSAERAGMRIGNYLLQYMLFHKDKMLLVQCAVAGSTNDEKMLEDAFNSYLPLFQMIGSSVVLHDKWGSDSSSAGHMFSTTWWLTIVISALLTWGIGLTVPLLIRFVIVRRPISKWPARGLVFLFWCTNVVIFTALGSESKTHAALFLVAVASYAILHRGYVPKESSVQSNRDVSLSSGSEQTSDHKDHICPSCGSPLRNCQVDTMLNNPDYNEWARKGYCSQRCFEGHRDISSN